MSLTATSAPARASHRAISRPIPAPAPVTSAVFPDRSIETAMAKRLPSEAVSSLRQRHQPIQEPFLPSFRLKDGPLREYADLDAREKPQPGRLMSGTREW